jgi:hypothetical protein
MRNTVSLFLVRHVVVLALVPGVTLALTTPNLRSRLTPARTRDYIRKPHDLPVGVFSQCTFIFTGSVEPKSV